jgi:hypothetical protein
VVGVIEKVETDDSRPVRVENRQGISGELLIDSLFEFCGVEGTKPVADGIVLGCVLGVGTDATNESSSNGGSENDLEDRVGVEGRALDACHWESVESIKSKCFQVIRRNLLVWFVEKHNPTNQTSTQSASDSAVELQRGSTYYRRVVAVGVTETKPAQGTATQTG